MGWTAPLPGTGCAKLANSASKLRRDSHAGDDDRARHCQARVPVAWGGRDGKAGAAAACPARPGAGRIPGAPPCTIGIEACATAHHWARKLQALGHQVRLVPPSYVKAYVKRNKNDAADAEGICEAVMRPTMRFVPVKAREQQAVLMLHRARSLVIAQRRSLGNAIRAHLAEFGMVGPQGRAGLRRLLEEVLDPSSAELPELAREVIQELASKLGEAEARERALEAKILAWHRANEISQRLATIPGIGPITASAIAATAPDPAQFTSGRHFAAWIGLVPRQRSTGGKERLGPISKRGDGYLRRLLVTGS